MPRVTNREAFRLLIDLIKVRWEAGEIADLRAALDEAFEANVASITQRNVWFAEVHKAFPKWKEMGL